VDGTLMPWFAFVFLMGHMSVNHIIRQMANSPSVVDITGAQMVLVMKLSAFCWNVHDGRLPANQLTQGQAYAAIREFPSILDFAGYVLFFPSLHAGPACDFVEYRRWLETSMFDLPPGVDPSKAPQTRKKRRIPRSGRPALRKAATGLFWIAAFMTCSQWFNIELLLSQQYMKRNFLSRVFALYMVALTARLKYYGVWMLTEGACILTGMGYNGIDPQSGKVSWNKLENVSPWGLETAQSPHTYLASWNQNTNHWLRNYVYLRVTPKGKKPGFRASLATFATSALWHGFYPGYYFTFVLGAFIQTCAKSAWPLLLIPSLSSADQTLRFPPPHPPLRHVTQRSKQPYKAQTLLRRPVLAIHPAPHVIHCRSLHSTNIRGLHKSLGAGLFLRRLCRRGVYGRLLDEAGEEVSRTSVAGEEYACYGRRWREAASCCSGSSGREEEDESGRRGAVLSRLA
jgi:lysophospholipid acyltransferase